MSDEQQPEPIILPDHIRSPEIHANHYCVHPGCTKWGSFGFPAGRGETKWLCGEHKDDAER